MPKRYYLKLIFITHFVYKRNCRWVERSKRESGEWASSIQELYKHVCKTPKKVLKILYSTCLRSHQIGATVQEPEVALEQINRIKHLKPSQLWFCFWLGGFPTLWFCLVVILFQLSHRIIQYSILRKTILAYKHLPISILQANLHLLLIIIFDHNSSIPIFLDTQLFFLHILYWVSFIFIKFPSPLKKKIKIKFSS